MKENRRSRPVSVYGLARSKAYRIAPVHALQITMQGVLIRSAVRRMASAQGLPLTRLVNETIVLSHLWDDVGDDPGVLAAYPGLRTRVVDRLLRIDEANVSTAYDDIVAALGAPSVVPPLLPGIALETLARLDQISPRSTPRSQWTHLSLLRLLATGLAQTAYAIEPARYRPLVDLVRRLSLNLVADPDLRAIIAEAKAEFLLGALASGSQELFPLAVPGLVISQEDMDVLGAANMFLGLPICFDKSVRERRAEGIDMPEEDRVNAAELSDYLARAADVLARRLDRQPDGITLNAYLNIMRQTHFWMWFPSPGSYARLDRARPSCDGRAGFGSIIEQGFRQLPARRFRSSWRRAAAISRSRPARSAR